MTTYVSNNEQSITTDTATFMITQRNIGFEPNDGKWVVSQLPELYWSNIGTLRQKRASKFLGVFDTYADVEKAISEATLMPIEDKAVESIGWVSC